MGFFVTDNAANVYRSPVTGSLEASGPNVDEIIVRARTEIQRVAGGREYEITRVELTPLVMAAGGEIPVWNATVDFKVADGAPPDPDSSPFESPSFETVEKGLPGPWNDKEWEADNGGR